VAAWAASQGPFNPTVAGSSNSLWANAAGIEGSSSFASQTVTATSTSDKLYGSSFSTFTVPTGATILGITVSFVREQSGTGQANTNLVQLTKVSGTPTGNTSHGSGANWTASPVQETWGATNDLWGTTWAPADVNSTGFGFIMNFDETGGVNSVTGKVQNYLITVTFSAVTRTQGIIIGSRQETQERMVSAR